MFTLSMANTDWMCGLVRHSPLTSPSFGELSQLMVGPTSLVCSVNLLNSKSCHRNLPCQSQHSKLDRNDQIIPSTVVDIIMIKLAKLISL